MRRRPPRLSLSGEVQLRLASTGSPLRLLDISLEGFATESSVEFAPDAEYEFEFSSLHCACLRIRAATVHCGRLVRAGRTVYVAGFCFSPTIAAAGRERIAALIRDIDEFRSISRE